jgi:pyruvoyl-dependent arginine decarboxylase (PvlArgDC)
MNRLKVGDLVQVISSGTRASGEGHKIIAATTRCVVGDQHGDP